MGRPKPSPRLGFGTGLDVIRRALDGRGEVGRRRVVGVLHSTGRRSFTLGTACGGGRAPDHGGQSEDGDAQST